MVSKYRSQSISTIPLPPQRAPHLARILVKEAGEVSVNVHIVLDGDHLEVTLNGPQFVAIRAASVGVVMS